MRRRGRFGWISRFFYRPHGRSFSAKVPTEPFFSVQLSSQGECFMATPGCFMATPADRVYNSRPPGTAAELRVGVIGYGYWGPNVATNFRGLETCGAVAISDKNPTTLRRSSQAYPAVDMTADYSQLRTSTQIDATPQTPPASTP